MLLWRSKALVLIDLTTELGFRFPKIAAAAPLEFVYARGDDVRVRTFFVVYVIVDLASTAMAD